MGRFNAGCRICAFWGTGNIRATLRLGLNVWCAAALGAVLFWGAMVLEGGSAKSPFAGSFGLMSSGHAHASVLPPFPVGSLPKFIVWCDLNQDGIQDLVTANFGSHDISVLLGNGMGFFH